MVSRNDRAAQTGGPISFGRCPGTDYADRFIQFEQDQRRNGPDRVILAPNNQWCAMSDGKILAVIFLGLLACATGGTALVICVQTVSGLGAGALALTGTPIVVLGLVSAACIYGIVTILKSGPGDKK